LPYPLVASTLGVGRTIGGNVAEIWRSIRRVTLAPVYIAVGLGWLAVILHVVIGNVIVRETAVGGFLARQIEKLPPSLSRPVLGALWFPFLLGWIVPLFLGAKRLFRQTGPMPQTNGEKRS